MKTPRSAAFTLIELLVVIAIITIIIAILFPVFATAREKARQSECLNNLKQMGSAIALYTEDFDETMPYDPDGDSSTPLLPNTGVTNNGEYYPTTGLAYAPIDPTVAAVGGPGNWVSDLIPYTKSTLIFQEPSSQTVAASNAVQLNHDVGYFTNGAVWMDTTHFSGVYPVPLTISKLADYAAVTVMIYDNLDPNAFGNERELFYRPLWSGTRWQDNGSFSSTATRQGPHVDIFNVLFADCHVKALKANLLAQTATPVIGVYGPDYLAGSAPFPPQ